MDEHGLFISLIRDSAGPLPYPEPQLPDIPPQWEELAACAPERPYKAVLFDVYGTLFSSAAGDIALAAQSSGDTADGPDKVAAFYDPGLCGEELRNFFIAKVKEIHSQMRQRTEWPEVQADRIWEEFLQAHSLPGSGQELALRYELAVNPVFPMPHAKQTISALRESGCVLGIISNAQFYTPLLFETFFDGRPEEIGFDSDLIFYSFEHGEAKPSPRLFDAAASRLKKRGISPEDCAFVGNDMLSDIYGAVKAGFQGILFAGDSRSLRLRETDGRVKDLSPHRVIRSLSELAVAGNT